MTITDGKGDLIYSSRDLKRKFPEQGFYNHIKIDTSGIVLSNSCRPFLDIDGNAINDGSIPDSKIIDVDFAKIKNVLIDTAQIKDAAITTAKIADLAVTNAKIANAAITNAKIANLAVTNAKIADLSASKINAGYIVTTQLEAGSNPSTGCILDGNGLRAYKSGTKMVDISEDPFFRGVGHFGDDNFFIEIGNDTYPGYILFEKDSEYKTQIYIAGTNYNELYITAKSRIHFFPGSAVRFRVTDTENISITLRPWSDAASDLGTSSYAWNNVYYCVANDVCSLGVVEEISNPLELLKNIKVSKDKYTPKEIPKADYKTLPKFIKTVKYSDLKKSKKNFKEHLQSVLSKNAEVTYEDDKKVTVKIEALDITATISLLLGAIRQLSEKIEALERGNIQ
ncbi:MAG: hypothetical protein ACTSSF_00455 [Candidatus Heimdallarchaeaceae archaeon]